jgi:dTDP-4-amino-4,6-dideoxygalactose transaminase
VGTWGDAGCFSFYPTKNLGGWGDGGAVVTTAPDVAAHVRLLRSHGEQPRYHHRIVGTTARLDALQAALLRVKLRRLDASNDDRRRLGAALREGLQGTSVELPEPATADGDHVYHLFIVRTKERDALRAHLDAHGISTAVHYPFPIHRTEAYAELRMSDGSLPVAERLAEEILTLPLFPTMSDQDVSRIVDAVRAFASDH